MATAVPAVKEVVPGTVAYELLQIRKVAKGGKTLPRDQFAEQIGITSSQLMGAEKGRKIKEDVWEKIVTAFPQLERFVGNDPASADTPQPVEDVPLPSDTMEPPSGEPAQTPDVPNTRPVVEIFDFVDDLYPLPSEYNQLVVLDVQPPTQTEEIQKTTHDTQSTDAASSVGAENNTNPDINSAGSVVGSTARYEQQHNKKRADDRKSRLFSNSEIQAFKRCPRKWYLAWYRKLLLKKGDVVGPRPTGTRVHYALEHYYVPDGQTPENPLDALKRIQDEDRQVLVDRYGSVEEIPADVKNEFIKSRELEHIIVEGYMEWIQEEGIDQGLKVVAPEQYVEVTLPIDNIQDKNIKIIGKLDVRVQRDTDGAILFIDHKTKQSLDTSKLHMDEQMLHYHLLEWMNNDDVNKKIDGVLYNMLKKVKRTDKAKPPFYAREQKTYNFVELQNYKKQLIGVIKNIQRASGRLEIGVDHQEVVYPNKTEDCSWSCDFYPVCPMFDDGSRADDMISEYYREGDPLEYYDDKHLKGK